MSDRISLNQQIEEVQRELNVRAQVYPGLIARGRLRQSEADYQSERLRAVLKTLKWLQENEDDIRAAAHNSAPFKGVRA